MSTKNEFMKPLIFLLALFVSLSIQSASVELEWFCKDDTNVKEYSLNFGTESGLVVTTKIQKTRRNTFKIDTLTEGKSYWFQITPILKSGANGKPSKVLYYRVPSIPIDDTHSAPELRIRKPILAP